VAGLFETAVFNLSERNQLHFIVEDRIGWYDRRKTGSTICSTWRYRYFGHLPSAHCQHPRFQARKDLPAVELSKKTANHKGKLVITVPETPSIPFPTPAGRPQAGRARAKNRIGYHLLNSLYSELLQFGRTLGNSLRLYY